MLISVTRSSVIISTTATVVGYLYGSAAFTHAALVSTVTGSTSLSYNIVFHFPAKTRNTLQQPCHMYFCTTFSHH